MDKTVRNVFLVFLMIIVIFPVGIKSTYASNDVHEHATTPVIVFLVDNMSVRRITSWMEKYPAFQMWVNKSDLGMMTMRTAAGRSVQNQILTLSTGSKQSGEVELLESLQEADGVVYVPGYKEWIQKNHEIVPLGDALKISHKSIEVIGNGDIGFRMRRLAPLLVSDKEGIVPLGSVDDVSLQPSLYDPLFYRSDIEQIKSLIANSKADFLVVELGDLKRFFSLHRQISKQEQTRIEADIEWSIIDLLLWTEKHKGDTTEIWLISPSVDPNAEKAMEWMTPIIRSSPHVRGEAILYSPTTRQPGIVANVDFYPTILSHFEITQPIGIEGRTLERLEGHGVQQKLLKRAVEIFYIHKMRPDLLYQVISIQVLLLVVLGGMSLYFRSLPPLFLHIGHYLLIYVLMVPFLLLLLAILMPMWSLWYIHLYLIAGGLVVAYVLRNQRKEVVYGTICFAYVALLLIDGLLQNTMMKRSFLGYDPIIGARYYGIGNEYMGVLVGSGLLLFYLLYQSMGKWKRAYRTMVLLLFLLLILYYLAMPNGGTNAGGTVAWLVAIVFASRVLFPKLWVGKRIVLISLAFIALFSVFLLVQYMQPSTEQTHIGRLLHQIISGGVGTLTEMIERKWEMNMRLMKVSTWSKLFVTSLIVLACFLLQPKRRQKVGKFHIWSKAFRTIVWVSLVNLLVNDSGVVAAALSLLFAAVPLLHLVLYERTTVARVQV